MCSKEIRAWMRHTRSLTMPAAESYAGRSGPTILCVCRWAGYDAWTLNSGFHPPGPSGVSFTHVVVLVRVPVIRATDKNNEIITLHDPSVNTSYTHADGTTPLDYFEMLAKLNRRKTSEIGYSGAVDPAGADEPTRSRSPSLTRRRI